MTGLEDTAAASPGVERVNGHEIETLRELDDVRIVKCTECMVREVVREDDNPEDHLELMTPECKIEWLREPDGDFRGIALRNASGFSGRELITVDSDIGVTDTVRVYDDDANKLASLLDARTWSEDR